MLEAMLPRIILPTVRLVELQLAADPESYFADAAAEGVGPAAPLAGERLARQLCHFLLEVVLEICASLVCFHFN